MAGIFPSVRAARLRPPNLWDAVALLCVAGWPVAVQVGVPVLGLAGWLAARELARSPEAQARPAGAQPVVTA